MKVHIMKNGLYSSIIFSLLASTAFASHTAIVEPAPVAAHGKFYVGVFGGGGTPNQINATQYGTAFYTAAAGGPLAVNAFGNLNNHSSWLAGAQIGYQKPDITINPDSPWTLGPAMELEGFYFGDRSFTGYLMNQTTRLPEHDFSVTYPMQRSVFLVNAVLFVNKAGCLFHPYVGAGFGGAIVKISGADSAQISPPEPGINHYNANTTDMSPTVAGQIKAGLGYDINKHVSLFVEYRWLYLSSTHFSFGSTVYPTHVPTSNWQVKLGSQQYNIGTAGIKFSL